MVASKSAKSVFGSLRRKNEIEETSNLHPSTTDTQGKSNQWNILEYETIIIEFHSFLYDMIFYILYST